MGHRKVARLGAIGCGGAGILVILGALVSVVSSQNALNRERALARAAGIPLSIDQFVSGLPVVSQENNAAPLLVKFHQLTVRRPANATDRVWILIRDLRSDRSSLAEAKNVLAQRAPELELLEQAAKRSGCRFDRKWSDGGAVLFPEYPSVKQGCALLLLRAWVSINERRDADAIQDLNRVVQLGSHLMQEPIHLSHWVALACWQSALRVAANGLYRNPGNADYIYFLSELSKKRVTDWKRLVATDALFLDTFFEMVGDPEGWRELRREEPLPVWETSPLTAPMRAYGRAEAWRSARLELKALEFPLGPISQAVHEEALHAMNASIAAAPSTHRLMVDLDEPLADIRIPWVRFHTTVTVTLKALTTRKDFSSAAEEWNEIRSVAKWEGRRLTVTTTCNGEEPSMLTLPGDSSEGNRPSSGTLQ